MEGGMLVSDCRALQPEIQSVGLPPERHADRVVLEMLKLIAEARQQTWPKIRDILGQCPDGNPKAQARMLAKLKRASHPFTDVIDLKPGKRGRYQLIFVDTNVWNPETKGRRASGRYDYSGDAVARVYDRQTDIERRSSL
jgi:hypothetical protein